MVCHQAKCKISDARDVPCIDLAVACHPRQPSTIVSICGRAIYRLPVHMCAIKANKSLGLKEDVRQTNQVSGRRKK
jgi:hypothetical protein